jgi:hypothetical protein
VEYVIKWTEKGDTQALSKLLELIDVMIEREIEIGQRND